MVDNSLDPFERGRPRGILTERERTYLLGRSKIEEGSQPERSIRQSIREHLKHSILDFEILYQTLEERDREMVFFDEERVAQHVASAVPSALAFFYQHDGSEEEFSRSVEGGVYRALQVEGWIANVDVEIEVDRHDKIRDVADRLGSEGPDAVTNDELRTLLFAGEISNREFAEYTLGKTVEE